MLKWTKPYKDLLVQYKGNNQYIFVCGDEVLPTRVSKRGYIEVRYNRWTPIHQLICKAYHGGYKQGYSIHHIDEMKNNNRIENLIPISTGLHKQVHIYSRKRGVHLHRQEIEVMKKQWDCYEELAAYKTENKRLELIIEKLTKDVE